MNSMTMSFLFLQIYAAFVMQQSAESVTLCHARNFHYRDGHKSMTTLRQQEDNRKIR